MTQGNTKFISTHTHFEQNQHTLTRVPCFILASGLFTIFNQTNLHYFRTRVSDEPITYYIDLRQVSGLYEDTPVPSYNKTECHNYGKKKN